MSLLEDPSTISDLIREAGGFESTVVSVFGQKLRDLGFGRVTRGFETFFNDETTALIYCVFRQFLSQFHCLVTQKAVQSFSLFFFLI